MKTLRHILTLVFTTLSVFACGCIDSVDSKSEYLDSNETFLGTFRLKAEELVVSDPSYPLPDRTDEFTSNEIVGPCRSGEWKAYMNLVDIGDWGRRCSGVRIIHAESPVTLNWVTQDALIGVDTAQAGIFDRSTYRNDTSIPGGFFAGHEPLVDDELWFSMCSSNASMPDSGGVVPGGVVAKSGVGDGAYAYQIAKDGELVVGVRVIFITQDELK